MFVCCHLCMCVILFVGVYGFECLFVCVYVCESAFDCECEYVCICSYMSI